MMLFAEDPNNWGPLASWGGAIIAGFFAWLTAWTNGKNNARTVALETEVKECKDDRSALRSMYDALIGQLRAVGVLPPNENE
jgi:hypothetical protein